MAFTLQDVVNKGRDPLNDADKARYADPDLLSFAIDALVTIKSKRPDLFVGNWTADFSGLTLASAFPIADLFVPAVAEYVTARAECRDDEHVVTQRAAQFFSLFAARL